MTSRHTKDKERSWLSTKHKDKDKYKDKDKPKSHKHTGPKERKSAYPHK